MTQTTAPHGHLPDAVHRPDCSSPAVTRRHRVRRRSVSTRPASPPAPSSAGAAATGRPDHGGRGSGAPADVNCDRDVSPLGVARSAFEVLVTGPAPLCLDGRDYPELPNRQLPLHELRHQLLRRSCPRTVRDRVWAELVGRSRTRGAAWTVGCVGVALPALTSLAAGLSARFAGDASDVHAEILRGFLTGLASIDIARPGIMTRLRWCAYRAGHAAVREALDTPVPCGMSFRSAPPPTPAGHPDFVLARAVAAGVITQAEAELIGVTRLEDVPLREWGTAHGLSYPAARQARHRAERRLATWISAELREDEPPALNRTTRPRMHLITGSAAGPAGTLPRRCGGRAGAGVSHHGAEGGVQRCGRIPPRSTARPMTRPEEPRCA